MKIFSVCLLFVFLCLCAEGQEGGERGIPTGGPPEEAEKKAEAEAEEGSDGSEASESDAIGRLDEQVVTPAGRWEEQFEHTYMAYALSRREIQNEKMPRTIPEALKEIPGVMVQKTSHGQGSPYLRGFTGFRTLFLVDGIRLNNSVFREGPNQYWNTVDYLSVESMEVVKGVSSVLYGSDAIGGTVNVIPRRGTSCDEGAIHPRFYYRFASAENSHTGRAEASGNCGEDVKFLGGFFYKDFGDLESASPTNLTPRSGYSEFGGDLHLDISLSDTSSWEFGYYGMDQNDAWRTHATVFSKSFHGTAVGTDLRRKFDQDRHLAYTRLGFFDWEGPVQEMSCTVSWQYQREEEDRVRSNRKRNLQESAVGTLGVQFQATSESAAGDWTYGVEYYRDFVNSSRRDYNADGTLAAYRIQGPVGDEATYDLLGIYAQDEFECFDFLTVVLGMRYTHAWADADEVEDPSTGDRMSLSDNWGQLTGSARFSAEVERRWRIFGGVSQGFRAPNLSDLTRFDIARSTEIETPVHGLSPESFVECEIGVKANYEKFYLQGSYYYTFIRDMIVRYPTGRIVDGRSEVSKKNEGDGFVHGVECEAGYSFLPEWLAFGGFSWLEGLVSTFPASDLRESDEPLDRMPPASGFVGIRWTHPSGKYWAEGVVNMARHQHRLSTRDEMDTERIPPGGTPGYATVSLRGGAEVHEHVRLSAAIENIGDKDYRVHGSGQNEPGINAVFAVDVGF